jgi:hypothetical protein
MRGIHLGVRALRIGDTEKMKSHLLKISLISAAATISTLLPNFPSHGGLSNAQAQRSGVIQAEDPRRARLESVYKETVKRAYAINGLFYRVYTPTWEGANGAIGDAFLFAATRDPSLLNEFTAVHDLRNIGNGNWVDDRAWACLAEMYWWDFTGRNNNAWVEDVEKRYLDARQQGRLSNHEGFWSWYNWPPNLKINDRIFTNSNMNEMVSVACWLYEATHDKRFYNDAMLVWNGDRKTPGIEKTLYRGDGRWEGKPGRASGGKQLPWEGASYCSIGASMYRMTGAARYKKIAVATAKRIMDPANRWVDSQDFFQIGMDGNGAFVNFILDAYMLAPDQLPDIPDKVQKMLEHVWTNHHGQASVTLHRLEDDGIRNGWNPFGGEEGYGVDQVGTVHAQSQAVRAFGVFAYVLSETLHNRLEIMGGARGVE